jgi:hypothetical protein
MPRKPDGDGCQDRHQGDNPKHQPHHWTHQGRLLHRAPSAVASPALTSPRGQTARFLTQTDYSPPVNRTGGLEMSLTPPTTAVFVISLILAALALIGKFMVIPVFTDHGFWVAIIAYVILAIGNLFRGV